ncbi:ATP-binding cassette domain-containing protein [Nocardioides sp. W3-2-3]|nr:ATP-binding cassette domain-containing protein [Nocardioides convexus]
MLIGLVSRADVLLIGVAATYAMVMLSLVLLTGYGGHVSLAQFTFAGVGALAYARLDEPNLLGLALAALIAAGVGALVALPVLRLTGLYLALSTLAFAVLMDKMIFQAEFAFKFNGTLATERVSVLGVRIGSDTSYVWFMVLCFVLMGLFLLWLRRGALGRILIAMRDSPSGCGTLGLDLRWFRVGLFSLSAGMAGLAGGLFAGLRGTVGAADFLYFQSLLVLLLAVVFGVTSVTGALLGGTALMLLPVWQSSQPELAGLLFAVLGFGAVLLGRDPNGIANHLFRLGRWADGRVVPQPAGALPRADGRAARGPQARARTLGRRAGHRAGHRADQADQPGGEPEMAALLEVEDVVVRFGGVTAVDSARFSAERGQITGLIGPNGAGKTTCFNVITGLQRPTSGRVRYRDRDVTRWPVHRRAQHGIGRTFQRLEAFGSLSVRDNVRVARDIAGGPLAWVRPSGRGAVEIDALLDRVGIGEYAEERADAVPTGTARLLEPGPRTGLRPAGSCCSTSPPRAWTRPRPRPSARCSRSLAGEGVAILMVEHDMDLVMAVCDDIHVLDFGRIIASGTPALIRDDPAVQRAYLGYAETDHTTEIQAVPDIALEVAP